MTFDHKRSAALAAMDRILERHRQALAASEKTLATLDEVEALLVGGSDLVSAGFSAVQSDRAVAEARVAHCLDVVIIAEYEREVLFGAEEPAQ